jgi:chaperonin GroEL
MRKDYQNPRALAVDAAIFVSDLNFDETRQLVPLLDIVSQAGIKNLVIIANNLSDSNIGLLLYVSRKIAQFQVFAVKAPPPENGQAVILEDIATLTGAKPYLRVLSSGFDNFRLDDLGHARRSWADKEYFGIIAGQGSPQAIRAHLDLLKKRFAAETDLELRKKIRQRIGKLLSGGATIFIGGSSEIEIKARKEEAERTAEALRGALLKGVLPGGGAAFLDCIPLLHSLGTQTNNEESKVAYRILRRALEEPTRTIIQNAGYDSNTWIELIEKEGSGFAFDARAGKAVHMTQAGILDSAGVVIDALYSAAASAALALTVDTLVHHKNPQISVNP